MVVKQAGEVVDDKGQRITLTLQRRGPGRRSAAHVTDEDVRDEEGDMPVSSQFGARGYRATHEEIAAHRLLQQQQAAMRERGRPSFALVDRLTNASVRDEIAAARQNEEQITRAIDSILDRQMVAGTIEVTASANDGSAAAVYARKDNVSSSQHRSFINISPSVAAGLAAGRPHREITVARQQQLLQQQFAAQQVRRF